MPRRGVVPTVASPRRKSQSGGRSNGAPPSEPPANGNGNDVAEQLEGITLEDGTQMPVGLPPGMDPGMARELVEYLRKNPEMAKATYNEAQRLLQANPSMASELPQLQRMAGMQSPEQQAKLMQLKDDPELKDMFDDIQKHGTAAMERYWNDTEMMTKISQKMAELNVSPSQPSEPTVKQKGSKYQPETLHDAAKSGDTATLQRLIDSGEDVNLQDARGITPLGVAVGFNRLAIVKLLLSAKAKVDVTDGRGNTPLHYAAGYGRKEAAQLLLEAGAVANARNVDEQTPADAARMNREMHMVRLMEEHQQGDINAKYL